MKYTIATASILACLTIVASGALSIRGSNLIGFDSSTSAVVDNNGNVLSTGSVSTGESDGSVFVGSFGSLTNSQIQALGSGADIDSVFTSAGSIDLNNGLFDGVLNVTGDTSFLGGDLIYTVIGNESSIANSTQFLIYQNGGAIFIEDPGTNEAAILDAANLSNLLVGEHNNFSQDFGAGDVAAFNLVAIPEPSSSVLLGLGGLAFVLRRRR